MNLRSRKQCAILSMSSLEDFESYDNLLVEPLGKLGWSTQTTDWRDESIDWNQFDAVLIRSTWDYQQDPQHFLRVLQRIDKSSAILQNCLQLVEWNIKKTYLKSLQNKGFSIVPTIWGETLQHNDFASCFERLNSTEIIIKPVVSANADNTYRLTLEQARQNSDELCLIFADVDFMVQPFMTSIIDEGEYSLFFFGGQYSHAILKKPATGDFRVQEEHGGSLTSVAPEKALLDMAIKLNSDLTPAPLYSRLDFVRSESGFAIMEVELIEPSLYFNMDVNSADRFARAFDHQLEESVGLR